MGNEHGKEHDPNAHNVDTTSQGAGEKTKKGGKKPKKKDPPATTSTAPQNTKPTMLEDIDTSRLKHSVTDPIEDYYTVTEKVLGRYVERQETRNKDDLRGSCGRPRFMAFSAAQCARRRHN